MRQMVVGSSVLAFLSRTVNQPITKSKALGSSPPTLGPFVCWKARRLGSWDAAGRYKPSATLEPLYPPRTLEP
jgi:hypothetical protein